MKQFDTVIEEGRIVRYKALQKVAEEERQLNMKEIEAIELKKELARLRGK